jgi:glycosyltransferase involved in cell wall biosynthesis
MARSGHGVMVVAASDRGAPYRYEDQGVQVVRIQGGQNPFWAEGPYPKARLQTLKEILDEFPPDILHNHENVFFNLQVLRMRSRLKMPLVSSCYFLPRYITHYMRFGSWGNRQLRSLIWKYIIASLNRYDRVIFSTRSQAKEFLEHGLRVPPVVISNGVNTTRYHLRNGAAGNIETRYHLPDGPRILFVGRLMKDKRIDLLIQAMVRVLAERPAHLLVVGRGSEQAELESLRDSLGLHGYVHLLGYVPEEDLPGVYQASDLFAIASICEVQSIPALQAAASGLPMAAVDAAALPELVQSGVNGFLAPPDDPQALGEAILKILSDDKRYQGFSQASLQIGQGHSETATFQAYEDLYQSLLKERR